MMEAFDAGAALRSFGDFPDDFTQGEIRGAVPADCNAVVAREIEKLPDDDPRRLLWRELKPLSRECEWFPAHRSGGGPSGVPVADRLNTENSRGQRLQRLSDRFREMLQGAGQRDTGPEIRLNDCEQSIVQALRECGGPTRGETLAVKAGYGFNAHFKGTLAALVRHGILEKDRDGYRLPGQDKGQD